MSYSYQIEEYLKNNTHFMGCFPSDMLPTAPPKNSSLVANYSPQSDGGTHWVAMINLNTHNVKYFDSYGFEPDSEDMILDTKTNFKEFLLRNSTNRKYKYNNINIQSLNSDVCGEYCIKSIRDGLPIENNRINNKWKKYVQSSSTESNDRRIKKEIKIRHI